MIRTIVIQCDIWPKFALENNIRFTFKLYAKKELQKKCNEQTNKRNRRRKKNGREIHFAYINSEHYKFCMIDLMMNFAVDCCVRSPHRVHHAKRNERKKKLLFFLYSCLVCALYAYNKREFQESIERKSEALVLVMQTVHTIHSHAYDQKTRS